MAKGKKYRVKKEVVEEEEEAVVEEPQEEKANAGFKIPLPIAIVFALGFLLYAQTVSYDYCLDDKLVITHNSQTKQGLAGIGDLLTTDFLVGFFGKEKNLLSGGRYRPLSTVTFAIEWEFFGPAVGDNVVIDDKPAKVIASGANVKVQFTDGKQKSIDLTKYLVNYTVLPNISHFINALMYAFTCILLYLILLRLIPPKEERPWYLSIAFVATLIFTCHPLHTEAIANIKGRDEILSLLLALGALYYTFKSFEEKRNLNLFLSALCMFGGILAKETAITFLGVIPLAIYFFADKTLKENIMTSLPLFGVLGLYMIIRIGVLGWRYDTTPVPEVMNNPFLHAKGGEEMATIFYTMGYYLKLLFYPHPLTHDYYPWHPLGVYTANTGMAYPYVKWSDIRAIGPLLVYIGLLIYGLRSLKTKSIPGFCVLFYLGTFFLVSNIPFPVGTLLNERFMFMPSIGFGIIIAHFLLNWLPKKMGDFDKAKKVVLPILIVIVGLFSFKTVTRNTVWEDDFHLSTTDVKVSHRSAKSNMSAGLAFVDHAKTYKTLEEKTPIIETAIKHLKRSLATYPRYIQPMLIMGNAYYEIQDYPNAIDYFEQCLRLNPKYNYALQNLNHIGELCTAKGQPKNAVLSYQTLIRYDKTNVKAMAKLGELYGKSLNDLPSSMKYLKMALEINPKNSEVLQKLGVAYAMSRQPEDALKIFQKGLELQPKNAHILMNIGITYNSMGKKGLGQQFLDRAFAIDPSLRARMGQQQQ